MLSHETLAYILKPLQTLMIKRVSKTFEFLAIISNAFQNIFRLENLLRRGIRWLTYIYSSTRFLSNIVRQTWRLLGCKTNLTEAKREQLAEYLGESEEDRIILKQKASWWVSRFWFRTRRGNWSWFARKWRRRTYRWNTWRKCGRCSTCCCRQLKPGTWTSKDAGNWNH